LFGHEKGAFTGASSDKRGLFEAANGGTIFLDEIGEMPLHAQVKLLRVLQEKEIARVGSTRNIKIDVRVLAATNRDLRSMVNEGCFRQDLYYRVSAFEIQVPPLRERREDIPSLASHFLEKLSSLACQTARITIEEDALNVLANHDWHGNVRELENVINRLVVIAAASTITSADVESVLGNTTRPTDIIQYQPKRTAEVSLPLRPNRAELCEDETITTYMRRVKLDLLTAAIAQYPSRTAAAQRLGLTKDALKRQLRYLRNTTARSANISTNGLEEL